MKVWKYPLQFPTTALPIPKGGKIVSMQVQVNTPCIWVLVDPDALNEIRTFTVFGTGHKIPDDIFEFVGTYQEGMLVWHVFEFIGDKD